MFNDVGGYLVSREFLTQVAYLISTLLSTLFGQFITGLFNQP